MLRWLLGLCILAGIVAGIVLGALNPDPVLFDLGVWRIRVALGALVAGAVVAGISLGLILALLLRLAAPRSASPRRDHRT